MPFCPKCKTDFEPTPARLAAGDLRCPKCRNRQEYLARLKRPEEVAKMRARQTARFAVAQGKMKRHPCEVCGEGPTEAHHDDYAKPLEVRWLCFVHHQEVHRAIKRPRRVYERKTKYPWAELSVGDSLFVEGATTSQLFTAATAYAKRRNYGWKFTTCTLGKGAQILRTA